MTKIIRIVYDDSPECPMEWDGQWTLISFNRNSIHYQFPELFIKVKGSEVSPANIGLVSKFRAGLAYFLDYYEHGLCKYSLHNEGMQCRWDTSNFAGILIWKNKPGDMGAKTQEERAKDARGFLETYNNWMNGCVYGYQIMDNELNHLDSCYGFYETDYLSEEIVNRLEDDDEIMLADDITRLLFDKTKLKGRKRCIMTSR